MKVGEEVQQENFGQQEYRMWAGRGSGQGAAKRRGGAKRLFRRCTPLRFRVQYGTAAVERPIWTEASVSWQWHSLEGSATVPGCLPRVLYYDCEMGSLFFLFLLVLLVRNIEYFRL